MVDFVHQVPSIFTVLLSPSLSPFHRPRLHRTRSGERYTISRKGVKAVLQLYLHLMLREMD